MSWFTGAEADALRRDISDLKGSILELRQEKKIVSQEVELSNQIVRLKNDLTALEIAKGQVVESNAREQRELTHMIGLEKRRQEVDLKQAKQEAVLTVREENLAADRKRFDEQMAFREKRFEQEVGYLKEMLGEILKRLPTVTVDKKVGR